MLRLYAAGSNALLDTTAPGCVGIILTYQFFLKNPPEFCRPAFGNIFNSARPAKTECFLCCVTITVFVEYIHAAVCKKLHVKHRDDCLTQE